MVCEAMKQPFDPGSDFYRWGPIPGKYFYAAGDSLDSFFFDTVKEFNEAWPDSLWLALDGRIIWLTPFQPIWDKGKEMFFDKVIPQNSRQEIRNAWDRDVQTVFAFEQKITGTELGSLSDTELSTLILEFYKVLTRYWSQTFFPEIGNYGAEKFIIDFLTEHLKDQSEALRVMEIITAPERLSFYRREEVELLQTIDLEAHQRKYFWLQNSHNEVRVLPVSYFKERKTLLSPDFPGIAQTNLDAVIKRKIEAQHAYGLTDETMQIGKVMGESILWQDDRKMNTFISLHYKYILLQEVARRTAIPESDLFTLNLKELGDLIAGDDFSKEFEERRRGNGVWCSRDRIDRLSSEEVLRYWELYAEEKADLHGHIDIISGVIASKGPGIVRGEVQILLDPMRPFEEGKILVTTLTSPEYVFAMRKALAIITDTGGVGSHAAITSRELNKPCIVGTKIATKIFKDGDVVEVDTERGVVRKV
jgi:phosphohistidine swiveling domain-containing protein